MLDVSYLNTVTEQQSHGLSCTYFILHIAHCRLSGVRSSKLLSRSIFRFQTVQCPSPLRRFARRPISRMLNNPYDAKRAGHVARRPITTNLLDAMHPLACRKTSMSKVPLHHPGYRQCIGDKPKGEHFHGPKHSTPKIQWSDEKHKKRASPNIQGDGDPDDVFCSVCCWWAIKNKSNISSRIQA